MSEHPSRSEIRQRLQTLREELTVAPGAQVKRMPSPEDVIEVIDCVLALHPKVNVGPPPTVTNITNQHIVNGLDGLAPGSREAAKVGAELTSAWQQRIAEGLVKPGQRPKLPNMAGQRASYWRRVWNAVRGH